MTGTPFSWESFAHLGHAAHTGEPGITRLDPAGPFAYLASHPDEAHVFQDAMTSKAHRELAAVIDAHDFGRYRRICDVGGGHGHLLRAILDAHPRATGINFELPTVGATFLPVIASRQSLAEYRTLLDAAGPELISMIPTATSFSIIEAAARR